MERDLITVVIPIYNVEKYLKKCIDSILSQTYKNLEIILVDDGSTDNCSEICDKYEDEENRIKVIHKKNGGLSDARNAGINIANGKYITFVDSDDYIESDMIEVLYNNMIKNNAQISTCLYRKFFEGEELVEKPSSYYLKVYSNEQSLEKMMYQKDCTTSAWGKLYLTELFKEIRYPYGKICEDLPTTYLLFSKANKIVISNCQKYYYLQRKNSIIHSKINPKRIEALNFAEEETNFIKREYPSILKSAINREFMEAVFILCQLEYNDITNKEYYLKVKNIIKKNRKIVVFDKKSKIIYRIYAILSYFGCKNLARSIKIASKLRSF